MGARIAAGQSVPLQTLLQGPSPPWKESVSLCRKDRAAGREREVRLALGKVTGPAREGQAGGPTVPLGYPCLVIPLVPASGQGTAGTCE